MTRPCDHLIGLSIEVFIAAQRTNRIACPFPSFNYAAATIYYKNICPAKAGVDHETEGPSIASYLIAPQ